MGNHNPADYKKGKVPDQFDLFDAFFQPFGRAATIPAAKTPKLLRLTTRGQTYSVECLPSPNRRRLLLRVIKDGESISTGPPDILAVFDLRRQKLIRVYSDPDLLYPLTHWSPDGRYIAFILGGRHDGSIMYLEGGLHSGNPRRLVVLDVDTGKMQIVMSNVDWLRFSWTARDTLLFTSTDPTKVEHVFEIWDGHSAIYEWSATGGARQKMPPLIDDYYATRGATDSDAPAFESSPDGHWIAYYGTASRKKATYPAAAQDAAESPENPPGLYLFNHETHEKHRIGNQVSGFLTWSPNSKRLYITTPSRVAQGVVNIQAIDIATGATRDVATVRADEQHPVEYWSGVEDQFRVLAITRDESYLIVSGFSTVVPATVDETRFVNGGFISVVVPNTKGQWYAVPHDYAVNLKTGTVSELAALPDVRNENWFDGDLTELVK